jgi:large subunit ribosomal protein L24
MVAGAPRGQNMKIKLKKGDTVRVIAGDYRGRTGKVLKVFRDSGRIVVEGINLIKRHTRPSNRNPKGGIIEKEAPIHVSNVSKGL